MSLGQLTSAATQCYKEITTDLSIGEMLGYAQEMQQVDMSNILMKSVPGQFCETRLDGEKYRLDYYSIHKEEYVEMFNQYFNPYGEPLTVDGIQIEELHRLVGDKYSPSVEDGGGTLQEIATENGE